MRYSASGRHRNAADHTSRTRHGYGTATDLQPEIFHIIKTSERDAGLHGAFGKLPCVHDGIGISASDKQSLAVRRSRVQDAA